MDWMYLFYFLLGLLLFFGAKSMGKGNWNEEYTSLKQSKVLQGIMALGVALHHLAQKSCAPWNPQRYIIHGLDPFVPMGYMFVGVFLFCSGLGLYKSFRTKPDYLKGFFRRRILPIVIAFYLSEIIYTAVRLAMGEQMDVRTVFWYLSGLHMANFNAWYVIVIPSFYLVFWAAFRFCRREGTAIFWVFLFTLGYTLLGASIDHQNDWWMRGEWWYNSILLFPLGLVFGKHEEKITRVAKKGYWFWLVLTFAAIFLLYQQSEWWINNRWGYYGWGPLKVQHRLLSAGTQWLVGIAFVSFCFLLMMKVKPGNRILAWLGAVSLDFYLMHGIFVEMFGYNFLDISKSIVYIKNPALFTAAVLACAVPATVLFRWLRQAFMVRNRKKALPSGELPAKKKPLGVRMRQWKERRKSPDAPGKFRKLLTPCIALLLLVGFFFLLSSGRKDEHTVVMNDLEFRIPEYFSRVHADRDNALYECTGSGKKASYLVLDAEIPDAVTRSQGTLEMLKACEWLTEQEEYVSPQGIRMIRGFTETDGIRERRYYIECSAGLMVMRMSEKQPYYNVNDCEEAMLRTAESVRRVK